MFTNTYFWIFNLFIVPIITMRLLAEERKAGTLEVLLTSPVSEATVVLGKFLGALGFFLVALGPDPRLRPVSCASQTPSTSARSPRATWGSRSSARTSSRSASSPRR